MFDDNQEPKDMFADAEAPEKPRIASETAPLPAPAPSNTQPPAQSPEAISYAQPTQYSMPTKSGGALRSVIMVCVALACLGGAGYIGYRFVAFNAVPQQVSEVIGENPQEEVKTPVSVPEEPGEEKGGTAGEEDDDGPIAVIDSDGDGLSNEEERLAGTSVAKPDTDSDGLGDREEIKVYETDPKDADTDGDGYTDGEEVRNGYNPKGEGRLLQLPE